MTNIILHGCLGRMGQVVTALSAAEEETVVLCGVDAAAKEGASPYDYPVCSALTDIPGDLLQQAQVVIDFSTAKAMDALLDFVTVHTLPCVLCTTGLSEEQLARVEEAAKKTAILRSANMSLGINLLQKILKENAATLLSAGFDVDIVEKHHRRKLDAPSGTAIALGEAVNASLEEDYAFVYDRSLRRTERPVKEIGISAVRGGTIVGDHDVIFAGEDEVITLSHRAYSRNVFATGALSAAKFLAGKAPGLYDMGQVV